MKTVVTGSSGHLGEALMRLLLDRGEEPVGLDLLPGRFTTLTGSITESEIMERALAGAEAVIHTATLHKPHVATHSRSAFVETNIAGTLALLEAAVGAGVPRFVFASTTSAFGDVLRSAPGEPAAWIDRWQPAAPRNIYGATKTAAEDLCHLFHRREGLSVVILRFARFFPEPDDDDRVRSAFSDRNAKANEFLYRRVDLEDAAEAALAARTCASMIGFDRFVISATTPFAPADSADLGRDAPAVVARHHPEFPSIYAANGFTMLPRLDRVYDNRRAREALGWRPRHDFGSILRQLSAREPLGSVLARHVGIRGYHGVRYADGLYPVEG